MFNKTVFLILVLALFYGCGGGGGTTTDSTPDTTPPTVSSTSPANSATGVAVNSAITATFSEAMTASTVTTATFTVSGVSGTVSYTGTAATFTPSSNLANSTTYTATITTGVKDAAGNAMAVDYPWTFTTASPVSFASSIQPIFTSYCISCHQTGQISSFLPLTSGVSYGNLYNQLSTHTTGGVLLVKPFDSANSVLYQRISGIGLDVSEQTMPQNLPLLVSGDQTLIKTWIDEGALNN